MISGMCAIMYTCVGVVVENLGAAIDGDNLAMEFSFFKGPPLITLAVSGTSFGVRSYRA